MALMNYTQLMMMFLFRDGQAGTLYMMMERGHI